MAEFGDAQTHQFGYWYKSSAAGTPTWTTALDIDTSATPGGFLQIVDRSCVGGSTTVHRQLRSGR